MTTEFSQLNLHPQIVQAVTDKGYERPTPIQSAVIPVMLAGKDVIGQAQTGTGKTAAFSLPILHNLNLNRDEVQCLVMVPTRELALQISQAISEYGRYSDIRVLAVYGGQSYNIQIGRLKRGVDIVIGTPGRLLDLMQKKILDLSGIQTVVLDEADEMLSMGFIDDIEAILKTTPTSRQTALFSATMPPEIRRLSQRFMHDAQEIIVQREQLTVAAIEQRCYVVNPTDKLAALTRLFEVEDISTALIFVRTRAATGELANELTVRGFPAEALSGDLSQDMRERVMARFRQQQIKVLVATDVAARGLDIEDISHVFIYDLPEDAELYVHRVGRTGRAGKAGTAITLLTPREIGRLRRIEAYAKHTITRSKLPTVDEIERYREEQLINKFKIWLRRGRCLREREIVTELVTAGHDPQEIAAVALKIAREEEKQRPIMAIGEVQEKPEKKSKRKSTRQNGQKSRNNSQYSHEAGMVRLRLSKGKSHGVRTGDVVSTIAYHAEIPGYSLGKIRIFDQYTSVDVPEEYVAKVLSNSNSYRIRKQVVTVSVA